MSLKKNLNKGIALSSFTVLSILSSCNGGNNNTAANKNSANRSGDALLGAGSTYVYPLFSKAISFLFVKPELVLTSLNLKTTV